MTPLETVQSMYAAFAAGDVAAILDLVADDADWGRTVEGVPHLVHGIGKQAAIDYFTVVGTAMEFHGFAPRVLSESGDVVLSVIDVDLTVRANGKRVAFDEVHEFTVRDGKVVRYRPHVDTNLLVDAFA